MHTFRPLAIVVAVAALYIACAKLGLALAIQAPQVTAVWPPTGFALAALLRLGWRRGVPGIFLGAFIANFTANEPLPVALGIAAGNTLEAIVGVLVLRRLGFEGSLSRVRDVVALLVAVVVSPVFSATIGVSSLGLGGLQPLAKLPQLWWVWWVGDALGALVVAPFILVWTSDERRASRRVGATEAVLLFIGLVTASAVAFFQSPKLAVSEYVVFPFLLWVALRFGPMWTTTSAVAVNAIAVWGTHLGRGPFAGAGPESGLVLLQIFIAVAAGTALLLGAVAAQNRRAQERAEWSEQRLLLAMNAARMGVWDWDIKSGKVLWSEGLEPLHGLPEGGFAGTFEAFRELIHPEDRERVDAAIWKAVGTGSLYETEFRTVQPDGSARWIAARGKVIGNETERAVRMVGLGIDITRMKELEASLRSQASELAQADQRKDEFLAMLSHELRNPLAPISHAIELLDDPMLADEARDIIRRQIEHLTRLVDDLLDMSRITRGTIRLERRRVTLAAVVRPAVESWRHLIAQRRQRLSLEIPEEEVWIDVDPTRFTQIIANLVHNAAKFTPDGGWISVRAAVEDGSLVLSVRDSGEGMNPDVAAHAFDLFVQKPPPLNRPHGGLGLGLTLVRRLVELHGGTVSATSGGAGRGSEFVVRGPVIAVAGVPEKRVPVKERETHERRRILVVEDHADTLRALRFLLERDGYEVRTAEDGAGALATVQTFTPDLVILDIGLPGMDGYTVAKSLRSTPSCAGAILIALSGYGQPKDQAMALASGFDHHLLKPIDPPTLLKFLREAAAERPDRSMQPTQNALNSEPTA